MIGLDTNVLVRYIMQDDVRQAELASTLVESLTESSPGFVTQTSVVELVWVLSTSFKLDRKQIAQALDALLAAQQIIVDRADQVVRALRTYRSTTADFADCLIERTATSAGCRQTMTFDKKAAKVAGMTLISG